MLRLRITQPHQALSGVWENLVYASNRKLLQILKSLLIHKRISIVERRYTVSHGNCIYWVSWLELQVRQAQGHAQIGSLRQDKRFSLGPATNESGGTRRVTAVDERKQPRSGPEDLMNINRSRYIRFLTGYSAATCWYHKNMWLATTAATFLCCREDYSRSSSNLSAPLRHGWLLHGWNSRQNSSLGHRDSFPTVPRRQSKREPRKSVSFEFWCCRLRSQLYDWHTWLTSFLAYASSPCAFSANVLFLFL